ncbi:MAG: hypothetical protein MJZ63_06800, partial [Muribaculaceae bacterium]|nr:hypothetical protein [Muribaculaceae bacterium]
LLSTLRTRNSLSAHIIPPSTARYPPTNPLSLLIFILPAGGRGGEKLVVKMANYLQFANGLINFVV